MHQLQWQKNDTISGDIILILDLYEVNERILCTIVCLKNKKIQIIEPFCLAISGFESWDSYTMEPVLFTIRRLPSPTGIPLNFLWHNLEITLGYNIFAIIQDETQYTFSIFATQSGKNWNW